jgi:hypothetical protein
VTWRRAGTWALGLAALGLAALALYLIGQVRSLSGQLGDLRAAVANQPPTQLVAAAPASPQATERVDYDRLAAGIAAQLREGTAGGAAPQLAPMPASASTAAADHEAETLAADAMAPYLRRTDLTPEAWNELGHRVLAIPEDKRDAVLRQIFGAITRRELVPPPGISFADAFY